MLDSCTLYCLSPGFQIDFVPFSCEWNARRKGIATRRLFPITEIAVANRRHAKLSPLETGILSGSDLIKLIITKIHLSPETLTTDSRNIEKSALVP